MIEKRRERRRTPIAIAVAALAAVIALVAAIGSRTGTPPEPTAQTAAATSEAPRANAPAANASATARAKAPPPPGADASAIEPVDPHDTPIVPLGPASAFPYPPGSQPLTEGVNPATQNKEDNPVDAESGIHCVFGPRIAVVHPPDPLVIDLEVQNKLGALLPIGGGVARFRTEKADPEKGPWVEAPFVDDGSGKDLAPADRKYTATLKPSSADQATLLSGGTHLYVEVRFDAPNGLGGRKYVTVMQYSRLPDAAANGKYTESVADGSLVVGVGVKANVAGDYRVIGSLYAGADAIAFASKATHLEAGDGSIPLLFFGKILHDRGIDGPYQLRYVMLFQHAPPEEIPGETIDPAYTTKPYKASSFSDKAYVPPRAVVRRRRHEQPVAEGQAAATVQPGRSRGPQGDGRADQARSDEQTTPAGSDRNEVAAPLAPGAPA